MRSLKKFWQLLISHTGYETLQNSVFFYKRAWDTDDTTDFSVIFIFYDFDIIFFGKVRGQRERFP